ncbi:hypothetical protein NMG29_39160 [Streptomyces cocklensis]|uniref:Uncharacterized protein n=1 Tax=Actinacidiphila cocklensis TaxID=887465 RepID=A0A9W4E1B4_9ACTN|nr:hypothetical protein [Actinacidiphila cocklensis]MDD1064103.1 hypothetical protein [Actinacidiphila cocklensis]CAG6397626.1 conserved hypothetical protein [Actinacidiphila cocklensis]
MGLLQSWSRNRMTKGAIAARERGDSVYIHTLATPVEQVRSSYIRAIESEGWSLTDTKENPQTPKERWTLTFQLASSEAAPSTGPQE